MSRLRRVVVSGVGAVSPLGCGIEHVWRRLLAGECGVSALAPGYLPSNVPVHVVATVPRGIGEACYSEQAVFGRSVSKELAAFTQFAVYASDLALAHANLSAKSLSSVELERFGVTVSSGGVGSLGEILSASDNFNVSFKKLSPYFTPKVLINMAGGHVSIRHGLKGPLHTVATACAAGTHAVGDAFNFIRMGYADRMLAGGSEACIDPLSIAGFARLRALATSKDPLTASRPFDRDRNGFVMGEGACILVLEELEVALKRCAPIIAEVVGYGMSSDAFQPTLPLPSGDGAIRSMKMALADAGILKRNDGGLVAATEMDQCSLDQLSRVGYINAHATSTQHGDAIEAQAVQTTFAQRLQNAPPLYISSTKGATGHLLGAAGALELAFTALALRDGTLPPTINLDHALSLDAVVPAFQHVRNTAITLTDKHKQHFHYALKNSFGFGGTNASIVLKSYPQQP